MSNRMIRVQVSRTFNRYSAKDELLVEETSEIAAYVKAGLMRLIAVESTPEPAEKPKSRTKAPTKAKAKKKVDA